MREHSLLIVSSAQVASLAFFFYDICITFDDEVNTIWSMSHNSWIKWQFLFTRYFALAAQICLKNWYTYQVIEGSILMSAVEVVLMARVYALYQKNLWVGLIFVFLILGEIVAVIVGVIMNIPGDFIASNILLSSPNSFTYFGIGAIISQIAILVLTLAKYKVAVRGGWGKVPMMLMVRDGTAAFFILLVVTTMTVVATSMQTEYAPIGNSWFLSIVACSVSGQLCAPTFQHGHN
ncbi:hypothetical protein BDZ97DRAFT_1787764 [Flammula alnicola]|nr:hypothetical protein BDZ97DRAFT_1787764 [Flammula alnicola]